MHFGDDTRAAILVVEAHYVLRRSQRTESVLTLFVKDRSTRNLVYANADTRKATQADEVCASRTTDAGVTQPAPTLT